MSSLDAMTQKRLMKLPQREVVWEGDRWSLPPVESLIPEAPELEHYVVWVDGTERAIRSMSQARSSDLDEVLQALVQGMEAPSSDCERCRPKKIVVSNREIYLYLQSIAQDLKITLELVPALPMLDQFREQFKVFREAPLEQISPLYADRFNENAKKLFKTAPWVFFGDHQILEVKLNQWGFETVYVSTMGNAGLDFGLLAYRDLDTIKMIRDCAVNPGSMEQMEAAFLRQNCLFLNYEFDKPMQRMMPGWTSMLPYDDHVELSTGYLGDGVMRPMLTEPETIALAIILEAMHRFVEKNRNKLVGGRFPALTMQHQIPVPQSTGVKSPLTVQVSTMPELAAELLGEDEDEDEELFRDDLFPKNANIAHTLIDWPSLEGLRSTALHHQPLKKKVKPIGPGFPAIVVETSLQSGKRIINEIQAVGGLQGIGFNPARNLLGESVQLALLKAMDETLFLFEECGDDRSEDSILTNWNRFSKMTKNYCALIIVKKPKIKGQRAVEDTIAFYELKALSKKDFGLGVVTSEISDAFDFLFR